MLIIVPITARFLFRFKPVVVIQPTVLFGCIKCSIKFLFKLGARRTLFRSLIAVVVNVPIAVGFSLFLHL